MEKPVTKEILFEYFADRATLLQKHMIEKWLQEVHNEDFFYQCLDEWEATFPQHVPDVEQAHAQYQSFVKANSIKDPVPGPYTGASVSGHFLLRWMAVAASVIVIAGAGFFFLKDTILYQTYTTAYGETKTLILEDHSQVVLNAHSTLKVPRQLLAGSQREVWLEGEAFFSVTKQAHARQFVVHTGNLNVEVLGTKFNVSDRRGQTRVVLKEGKVKIVPTAQAKAPAVYMKPGDLVAFSKKDTVLKRLTVKPELYTTWQENKLIFEATPLPEVLQTVEDYYGIKIILQDTSFNQQRYTGTLPNNDLEVILNSLSNIYGLNVRRSENQILLQ